jgi:hypothetical protein
LLYPSRRRAPCFWRCHQHIFYDDDRGRGCDNYRRRYHHHRGRDDDNHDINNDDHRL